MSSAHNKCRKAGRRRKQRTELSARGHLDDDEITGRYDSDKYDGKLIGMDEKGTAYVDKGPRQERGKVRCCGRLDGEVDEDWETPREFGGLFLAGNHGKVGPLYAPCGDDNLPREEGPTPTLALPLGNANDEANGDICTNTRNNKGGRRTQSTRTRLPATSKTRGT